MTTYAQNTNVQLFYTAQKKAERYPFDMQSRH